MRKIFILYAIALIFLFPVSQADPNQAMERGYRAAQAGRWEEAIEAFDEARRTGNVRQSPQILLNLALAYDHAPGRLLTAASWYQAYLAVSPDASNAGQVAKRIEELVQAFDERMLHTIWNVEEKVAEFGPESGDSVEKALGDVEAARIYMGHTENATEKLFLLSSPSGENSHFMQVALAKASTGEITQAKQLMVDMSPQEVIQRKLDSAYKSHTQLQRAFRTCNDPAGRWMEIALRTQVMHRGIPVDAPAFTEFVQATSPVELAENAHAIWRLAKMRQRYHVIARSCRP